MCYSKEEDAILSCPTNHVKNIDEIILFSNYSPVNQNLSSNLSIVIILEIAELSGYPALKEFCPLGDSYVLSYNSVNPDIDRCMLGNATVNTCSSGAVMGMNFRDCDTAQDSFGNLSEDNVILLYRYRRILF